MKREKLAVAGPLNQLARDYHHVQQEHARDAPRSATRRHLETEMHRAAGRFEELLRHWVGDAELRGAWLRHLYENAPAPDGPTIAAPPLFRGETEAGSTVEIHASPDQGYDVVIDGAVVRHERVPWHLDPSYIEPIRIGEHVCRERFSAPEEAVRALARFVATSGQEPPWAWARALFEDGLIGPDFGLTPRGRRRLRPTRPGPATGGVRYVVLAADAARARVLTLEGAEAAQPTLAPLVEVGLVTNPERRTRDTETFTTSRPGVRRHGPGRSPHGTDDHRERHRHETDRHFAELAVGALARVWKGFSPKLVVVVASPPLLGLLRPILAREQRRQDGAAVRELARDITRLTPPALHDALADAGMLPRRGHRSLAAPAPGQPVARK